MKRGEKLAQLSRNIEEAHNKLNGILASIEEKDVSSTKHSSKAYILQVY